MLSPLTKKGDKLDCNNYRPISLTNFLQVNKLFSHQFGFRNVYSTNQALISLYEMIRKALDEDKFVCGVFIDL